MNYYYLYRYSRNNWIFLQLIGRFLLLKPGFLNYEAKHFDKCSNRTKQPLYGRSIRASVSITKIRIFLHSSFRCLTNKALNILGARTNSKVFHVVLEIKIEHTQ